MGLQKVGKNIFIKSFMKIMKINHEHFILSGL